MAKKISFEGWCVRIKTINPHIDIMNKQEPKGTKEDPFVLHCNKCGVTFSSTKEAIKASYKNRRNKKTSPAYYWCPACSSSRCFTGYNDIATLRPDLLDYFVDIEDAKKHTMTCRNKLLLKCPKCETVQKYNVSLLNNYKFNCKFCSDGISFPNKVCRALLKQLPVEDYIFEYTDTWTNNKQYDVWFSYKNKNYLLEFDGGQHFKDSSWCTKEEQQINDEIKNVLAKKNGYILIRIDCMFSDFDYIKQNILDSQLSEIFNLNKINWDKCHEDSLRSIVLEVADYYEKHHPHITEICKQFDLSASAVKKYLNQAAVIGKCSYDPMISMMNTTDSNKPVIDKRFKAYDFNNKFIGTFNLRSECVKYINENYNNVKIIKSNINYGLWTGMRIKGFLFEFVIGLENYYKDNDVFFDICKYYNDNTKETILDIANKFNITKEIVRIYIKAGTTLGLCEYKVRYKKYNN